MFKKLNNKGDTLAIVLIGMFVLSILGTLILGVTATNFNMKVSDKKAESAFYYAEKAIDEVYAGIGGEVMNCIQDEYTDVIEKYYSNKQNASASSTYDATNDFKGKVKGKLTDLYLDDFIKNAPAGETGVSKLWERILEFDAGSGNGKYIKNISGVNSTEHEFTLSGADNYKFTIFSPSAPNQTNIKYLKPILTTRPDGTTEISGYTELVSGDTFDLVQKIQVKNFGIRCDSESNGYSSSIVTDFVIDIPNIEINLSDSKLGGDNLGDLAKYSLIAQGHHLIQDYYSNRVNTTKNPAIYIDASSNITINGNVYAEGNVYDMNLVSATTTRPQYYTDGSNVVNENPSFLIGEGATLNVNSKIFACMNDFNVQNGARVTMKNKDGGSTDSIDTINSLQFYVNNIKTVGSTSGTETEINIKGNCIVKDDLQLDGDNNKIKLEGNYFGYGKRGSVNSLGQFEENPSTAIQGFTQINTFDENNKEHKSSSAIIINGKNTELDMSGLGKLVIMGRSYIDLESEGKKSYYMTGESISFKGNQHMYLASSEELKDSLVEERNPITMTDLRAITGNQSGIITYSDLGITNGSVVAKEIKNSVEDNVYFYVVNSNPVAQTNYFYNQFRGNANKKDALLDNLEKLEVNKVSVGGALYSVGAFMLVDSSGGRREVDCYNRGEYGITEQQALSIVDVIESRTANLTPSLQDDSSKPDHILGIHNTKEPANTLITAGGGTPYEYYINREKLLELLKSKGKENDTYKVDLIRQSTIQHGKTGLDASLEDALADEIKKIIVDEEGFMGGGEFNSKTVGYWISNKKDVISTSYADIDIGIVISEGPIEVKKDFIGLILTNGEVKISGNITVSACEKLTKFLLESYPDLKGILSDNIISLGGSSGIAETDAVITPEKEMLKYTDIVKKENWKRDTDN